MHCTTSRLARLWGCCQRRFSSSVPSSLSTYRFEQPGFQYREDRIPKQSDVVVIGGGVVGWSVAFWIRYLSKTTVTVIERDPSLSHSSSLLGLGNLRTQFSEPENIQMSLFTAEFLRDINEQLSVSQDDNADINFNPHGHLILADKSKCKQMEENYCLQAALELPNRLMTPNEVEARWPWLNVGDVHLASYGDRNEGWFDPWLLVRRLRNKAHVFGANYVVGQVQGFTYFKGLTRTCFLDRPKRAPLNAPRLSEVIVRTPFGGVEKIAFYTVVNCAGAWSSEIMKMAMAGVQEEVPPLPVQKRKQNIFIVRPDYSQSSKNFPGIDAPVVLDSSGLMLQRQGLSGDFAVCMNPTQPREGKTAESDDLSVDYTEYNEEIQPRLAKRIPAMASARIQSAWSCFNDYNPIDQSLIIGQHPYLYNMILATGSSGLGIQHAVPIGRAVAELVHYRHYKSIDLTRFSFDRFYLGVPFRERSIF
ncbi:FAD dependent oxidoreductase domain containing protein [Echinococcus multilocularis]|uniref:FAD-dependent oxidoreductase domain-containing protein 1 n=1 Tax=Echinococcus multilocularis TaxID=6211 RepID=A0A068YDK8_ECHMU|nr:FAD dependent oxidoreductase domain containing protein [Echinococcus multilocularis]